jgi:hypothetical protein
MTDSTTAKRTVRSVTGKSAAACVGLAALSLLLPWDLSFDPWGWVMWGRELTSSDIPFNTALYPAWKPLAVMFTTVFSLFGNAAPDLWLVVARTGAIAAVLLAYRVGARLGGRLGGVVAGAGVLLLPDWLRYFAGGASEPLLVAVVLGAVDRHLDGHRGQAFALGLAAALLRPEAWPFLLAYGVAWAWGRPRRVAMVGGSLVALAALWFVPEWIGAGDPFYGTWLARTSMEARATQSLAHPELAALRRSLGLALAPLVVAALVAVVDAARRRRPLPLVLAAGAVGWIAIVVVMTAQGYAGLGRFALPAGAVICVLGGAGIAQLVEMGPPGRRALVAAGVLILCLPFAVVRAGHLPPTAAVATAQDRLEDGLPALLNRVGGPARVLACRHFTLDGFFRPSMAWQLGVPVARLAKVRRPLLVFRLTPSGSRSLGGTEHHHSELVPLRPVRAVAAQDGWEIVASRRRSSCPGVHAGLMRPRLAIVF